MIGGNRDQLDCNRAYVYNAHLRKREEHRRRRSISEFSLVKKIKREKEERGDEKGKRH